MIGRAMEPIAETSFEEMYARELTVLLALGSSLTGSREVGAELVHEAMLRAYRDWETVGALDRPGAWVRRVLINLATDAHRRSVREQSGLRRLAAEPTEQHTQERADEFWHAVRALPPGERAATALRYIDDLSVAEIAAVLEVSEGTVKRALFMARRKLAVALQVEEGRDDDR